jgi:glutathione S-transferase
MMKVYGSEVSYFTGKFETYLRYKEIPYEFRPIDLIHYFWIIPRKLGASQMPTVQLDDGRWISDSTPMIGWLEGEYPEPWVIPHEPVQQYISLLLEDYADEWFWRPAMHYRWSYPADRRLASTELAAEVLNFPLPLALRRAWLARRQTRLFVAGDGIDSHTRAHAERTVATAFTNLERILSTRPFLLGARPTIADIGFMGPFWRHFMHDPTPAKLLRDSAPSVYAWANRMWVARASDLGSEPVLDGIPQDWSPLLREIGSTHLEALCANAVAHQSNAAHYDLIIQDTTYRKVPTSAYRVWCLERLRARYDRLQPAAASEVRAILEQHGCWEPMWRVHPLASGHDPAGTAPFCRSMRMVRD